MNRFRYWLSSVLIGWGVRLIPSPHVKEAMRMGISIGMNVAMGAATITMDEPEDKPTVH
jgi:hypothetical protein